MFIKDLANELSKSTSTITAYLKKHLPSSLSKRKNANNRLALFVDADGIAGARARYSPTFAPAQVPAEMLRLQDENASLRARVAELEAENAQLKQANVVKFERKALAAQDKRNSAATLEDVGQAAVDHVAEATVVWINAECKRAPALATTLMHKLMEQTYSQAEAIALLNQQGTKAIASRLS